jgi:hypothetical protein
VSGHDGWDELLAEAKSRLAEQEAEEEEASSELGESVALAEQETFVGRFRGSSQAHTKCGLAAVLLLWDGDGARRFIWMKTRLRRELDELQPNIGDEIAIVRGTDIPSSDPDRNPMQRFAVRTRASDKPLPEEPAEDDDLPF